MMRSGKSHLPTLRQTPYDASCSAQVVAEARLLSRCCCHIVMVAAAIQSALAIQAQERLCSEDNRECQGLDSASLEDVARMW
jgi:hypothetical protein